MLKRSGAVTPLLSRISKQIIMKTEYQNTLVTATAKSPCPHCQKPDWCYRLGDLTVCNRDNEPAPGWYKTSKTDKDGHYFYAPDRAKPKAKKQTRSWIYQDKEGNDLVRAVRIDKGDGTKPIRFQESWDGKEWVKGTKHLDRAEIPVYRYREIREAIAQGQTIFIVEGEKVADTMWRLGLRATTNIGGATKWRTSDSECLEGAVEIVICPDRDKVGVQHAIKVSEDFPDALWLYAPPSEFFWLNAHLPESQGLDVADWIADGASKELIKSQITTLSPGKFSESLPLHEKPDPSELTEKNREVIIEAEEIYTQKAVDCLFSDSAYLAIHDKLYKYNGTHYELCSTPRERRRILEWCKKTPVESNGKWKYALAKPETVNKIWTWVLTSFAVDPEEINPPGINCLNGVLRISWAGRTVSYELVPHDPEFYFTHVANFEYDPDADDRDCNRLLAALDPAQQTIFLRTIAASLDLTTVRKYQGRAVKALLCQGSGSNGKDTLREAIRCILGAGMTGASVTDFQQYDQGRKFPLTKIEHSQINWSSENSQFARLDSLQGLKAAITGEIIDIEPKNSMEYAITPRGVFLFNVNEAPLLQGGTEAIASRWAVLGFHKTFKKNANTAFGELEADSRFRYDPEFLEKTVCPALLNKILEQLQAVVLEGIDYSATEGALRKIQEQSNHLWQFVNEVGIQRSPGSRLYISDLWDVLEKWYVANGTLEYRRIGDRLDKQWNEQPRKTDLNVKASNQVARRFIELFPDVEKKRHTESDGSDRKGKNYLCGLKFSGEAIGEAKTTVYQSGEDGEAKLATLVRLVSEIKLLPRPERLTAIKIMNEFVQSEDDITETASPSSPQDPVKDSASPLASPQTGDRSSQSKIDVKESFNTNQQQDSNEQSGITPFSVTVLQHVEMPVTNHNTVNNCEHPPIEWVRDKAGVSWNIDSQNGDTLTGHRPGLRGAHEIKIDDCADIHYKTKTEEVEA